MGGSFLEFLYDSQKKKLFPKEILRIYLSYTYRNRLFRKLGKKMTKKKKERGGGRRKRRRIRRRKRRRRISKKIRQNE